MSEDLMLKIEEKFNQQIAYPNSTRLSKELLKLLMELRRILISYNPKIKDGEEYTCSGVSFLDNFFIDTISFTHPKKFLGLIDVTTVYFTTKKDGFDIVYSVSNDGFEKFDRKSGKEIK